MTNSAVTYRVYRGNRPYNRTKFSAYEQARNFIRKLVRSGRLGDLYDVPRVNLESNSIPLNRIGFSVKRREDKTGV